MAEPKGKIVTPTAFEGRETVAEEKAEDRAVKRSGSVEKAIAATKGRKVKEDRSVSRGR